MTLGVIQGRIPVGVFGKVLAEIIGRILGAILRISSGEILWCVQ